MNPLKRLVLLAVLAAAGCGDVAADNAPKPSQSTDMFDKAKEVEGQPVGPKAG